MSIISEIGRKSFKVKMLYFTIYSTLTIGALTMVYPFMLMLSGSTKSAVDVKYFDAVPRFFTKTPGSIKNMLKHCLMKDLPSSISRMVKTLWQWKRLHYLSLVISC